MNTVPEADRIKAVERVRVALAPIFGGTPSYKRKRGIYRALKRGVQEVVSQYQYELQQLEKWRAFARLFHGEVEKMVTTVSPFMALVAPKAAQGDEK